jgi:hypothetical protein
MLVPNPSDSGMLDLMKAAGEVTACGNFAGCIVAITADFACASAR